MDNADSFFELGIYFHNPFARWTKAMRAINGNRNCNRNGSTGADKVAILTVCGDAAHAMPPFLGQGANQAIQDANCMVNVIRQYYMQCDEQGNGENSLEDILQTEYKDKRWSTITSIMDITTATAKADWSAGIPGDLIGAVDQVPRRVLLHRDVAQIGSVDAFVCC